MRLHYHGQKSCVCVNGFIFPASNIIFGLFTFPLTDVICEIWGKKAAKRTVCISFLSQVFFSLMIFTSVYLPTSPDNTFQQHYAIALDSSVRVVIASFVAFLVAQMWDVFIYHELKSITKGRFIWLRNNVSTISSQFVNSSIFITILFYGTGTSIMELLLGSIVIKWIIALLDTPIVYFLIYFSKRVVANETYSHTFLAEPNLP